MARIRSVHPGLFTDEAFVSLSSDAQIFLIGLWTEADDQGVFEWKPVSLRMRLRPAKDGAVDGLLEEIETVNIIRSFEFEGRKYGAIRNFRKYQRPKSPNSIHPVTDDIRNYVGLTQAISEIDDGGGGGTSEIDDDERATTSEIPPQMEDGGGRREDGGKDGKKKDAAAAAPDPEVELFRRGREVLGKQAGGMVSKLLAAKQKNIALARAAIEQASTKSDPREYIGAIIRNRSPPPGEAVSYVDPRL